jgi:riboflavin synthase
MFTGIVQAVGKIDRLDRIAGGFRLAVIAGLPGEPLATGESIAVDGACLTVAGPLANGFVADLSEETVRRTTLAGARPGSPVNLERALRMSDRLGGHFVTGHIDGIGVLEGRRPAGNSTVYSFGAPAAIRGLMAEKGSIAADGISLTVSALTPSGFEVAVIPHTERSTSLAGKSVGAAVNLEADVIARYVQRLVARREGAAGTGAGLGELLKEYLG